MGTETILAMINRGDMETTVNMIDEVDRKSSHQREDNDDYQ
jgi:hypothetical protein